MNSSSNSLRNSWAIHRIAVTQIVRPQLIRTHTLTTGGDPRINRARSQTGARLLTREEPGLDSAEAEIVTRGLQRRRGELMELPTIGLLPVDAQQARAQIEILARQQGQLAAPQAILCRRNMKLMEVLNEPPKAGATSYIVK